MKKILGLDLGTTSIGWALVNEAENNNEESEIIKLGVRVIPMSVDEKNDFEKGNPITTNANRTLKRTARRNLQRFKLRRENLINILLKEKFIKNKNELVEKGNYSTFETYCLRAKAAKEKIELNQLARVLMIINKKRGYKSSRKTKNEEDGVAVDGMSIAKRIYEENITPGQIIYNILLEGKKYKPEFYRSDLKNEFDLIWNKNKEFYPDFFTDDLYQALEGKSKTVSSKTILAIKEIYLADIKGKRNEVNLEKAKLRSEAPTLQLSINELALVLCEINGEISNSSGYLGAISDRSKQLIFNKKTVGEYLYEQIKKDSHVSLKNQVFYRQDYFDEFETIWETQKQFHSILTPELKTEIRDVIIFYQRRLKSQKGLISFCEFENYVIKVDGKAKTVGHRVIPKSSPIFQETKIWQVLNNLELKNFKTKEVLKFALEDKEFLFEELNIVEKLKDTEILKLLQLKPKEWKLNYESVEGNKTNHALYNAYLKMLEWEGWDINLKNEDAKGIKDAIKSFFKTFKINTDLLNFDSAISGNDFDKQKSYQLWHLLYSAEDDKTLKKSLEKYGFDEKQANLLANISLQTGDYGSLSAKAIKKILPHLKEGNEYSVACLHAGYNHSNSETKEDLKNKIYKNKLEILKKNSLRNPVVEKILNQMVNVVNAIIEDENLGKPDEIRIELARELKKNAKQRKEAETGIRNATTYNEKIKAIIQNECGIKNPSRNDIIRYKLWEELKDNGYKTIYTNTYIPKEEIFSNKFDIEHIIPQSRLFDDSFSNKTLSVREVNIEKGNKTAFDYLEEKLSEDEFFQYKERVKRIFYKDKRAKYNKLLMTGKEIPDGFIERDLKNSQYIAKKARQMLLEVFPTVVSTSGSITARLRNDWGLINIMKELNWEKYHQLGLTEIIENKNGKSIRRIKDWTKRNDHRHHAMDALTVAFTKHNHIQYLNNLNARTDETKPKLTKAIYGIQEKELERDDRNKLKFKLPIKNFRQVAKVHLEQILVSHKAKNKVVTNNINKIKGKGKDNFIKKTQLTPRGQLHKETVYGKIQQYDTKEVKVNASFDEEMVSKVAKKKHREALLNRLKEFDNNPKKAFTGKNSLSKNPIYLDKEKQIELPENVKIVWLKDTYTIRKEIGPDLKIDKVIDIRIRAILQERINEYGDAKKAFSNLEENPIWINKDKGIQIKRVTIRGVENATALHNKKDHFGNEILNENNKEQAVDFVSLGNNHHVAIYKDEKGNLQEEVVSFYTAVERVNQGLPIINRNHPLGWEFLFSMKQNEYFIFPSENFDPFNIDLLDPKNTALISPNLYRVQKMTTGDYFFRHHLETSVDNVKELKDISYKRVGKNGLIGVLKVRLNHLGNIVHIGEY